MASITQPFVRVIRAGLRRYRQRNEIREEKEKLARYNEAVGTRVSWREICRARRAFGSRVDEFFYFEFYAKSDAERDAYLTVFRQDVIAERIGDDVRVTGYYPVDERLADTMASIREGISGLERGLRTFSSEDT